jgi:hypothetical protein
MAADVRSYPPAARDAVSGLIANYWNTYCADRLNSAVTVNVNMTPTQLQLANQLFAPTVLQIAPRAQNRTHPLSAVSLEIAKSILDDYDAHEIGAEMDHYSNSCNLGTGRDCYRAVKKGCPAMVYASNRASNCTVKSSRLKFLCAQDIDFDQLPSVMQKHQATEFKAAMMLPDGLDVDADVCTANRDYRLHHVKHRCDGYSHDCLRDSKKDVTHCVFGDSSFTYSHNTHNWRKWANHTICIGPHFNIVIERTAKVGVLHILHGVVTTRGDRIAQPLRFDHEDHIMIRDIGPYIDKFFDEANAWGVSCNMQKILNRCRTILVPRAVWDPLMDFLIGRTDDTLSRSCACQYLQGKTNHLSVNNSIIQLGYQIHPEDFEAIATASYLQAAYQRYRQTKQIAYFMNHIKTEDGICDRLRDLFLFRVWKRQSNRRQGRGGLYNNSRIIKRMYHVLMQMNGKTLGEVDAPDHGEPDIVYDLRDYTFESRTRYNCFPDSFANLSRRGTGLVLPTPAQLNNFIGAQGGDYDELVVTGNHCYVKSTCDNYCPHNVRIIPLPSNSDINAYGRLATGYNSRRAYVKLDHFITTRHFNASYTHDLHYVAKVNYVGPRSASDRQRQNIIYAPNVEYKTEFSPHCVHCYTEPMIIDLRYDPNPADAIRCGRNSGFQHLYILDALALTGYSQIGAEVLLEANGMRFEVNRDEVVIGQGGQRVRPNFVRGRRMPGGVIGTKLTDHYAVTITSKQTDSSLTHTVTEGVEIDITIDGKCHRFGSGGYIDTTPTTEGDSVVMRNIADQVSVTTGINESSYVTVGGTVLDEVIDGAADGTAGPSELPTPPADNATTDTATMVAPSAPDDQPVESDDDTCFASSATSTVIKAPSATETATSTVVPDSTVATPHSSVAPPKSPTKSGDGDIANLNDVAPTVADTVEIPLITSNLLGEPPIYTAYAIDEATAFVSYIIEDAEEPAKAPQAAKKPADDVVDIRARKMQLDVKKPGSHSPSVQRQPPHQPVQAPAPQPSQPQPAPVNCFSHHS